MVSALPVLNWKLSGGESFAKKLKRTHVKQ